MDFCLVVTQPGKPLPPNALDIHLHIGMPQNAILAAFFVQKGWGQTHVKKTPNALDVHLHHTRLREKLSENQGSRLKMMEKLPKTHDDLRSRREVALCHLYLALCIYKEIQCAS